MKEIKEKPPQGLYGAIRRGEGGKGGIGKNKRIIGCLVHSDGEGGEKFKKRKSPREKKR